MSQFSLPLHIADNPWFTAQGMADFSCATAQKARQFHRRLPGYQPTPLYELNAFARRLGVAMIQIKDESRRFGLNAFKILGGIYAIARFYCDKYQLDIEKFSFESARYCAKETLTFISTTDGNHGRGVAWAAQQLGQRAVIYMPKGSSQERVAHITQLGAECIVTGVNYDDTVRLTIQTAAEKGWILVQDTAWPGYTQIPRWIMQGYGTLADEAVEQMSEAPSHVFLQAGVGAMAASVLGYLVDKFGANKLSSAIVEPDSANCIYRSGRSGELSVVSGEMNTIMAGLACGEPNPLGWPLLRNCARHFICCDDRVSALGMRVLGNPLPGDTAIISGESGAVTMGVLVALLFHPRRQALMSQLGLNAASRILLISTEGDTDAQHYREVVWEGKNSISAAH